MKIIVTGSTGNISKPLAQWLVKAGHQVTVITRDAGKVAEIEQSGATAAVGSVQDEAFLTQTFTGADAVYTMVPPNFATENYRAYIGTVSSSYAAAIAASGVKKVVNLSSIGAHLDGGTGPISGIHDGELLLNALDGVSVKHLRAGFFYVNLFANIGMIKHAGIIGANYGQGTRLVLVHPRDIAEAAAAAFETPFDGKSVTYVSSDERTTDEIASALGTAIGLPELPWIDFTDEQQYDGMIGAGLPVEVANVYVEMGAAVRTGILFEDYTATNSHPIGKIKLEDFAGEFAGVYGG